MQTLKRVCQHCLKSHLLSVPGTRVGQHRHVRGAPSRRETANKDEKQPHWLIQPPTWESSEHVANTLAQTLIYKDENIIVLNKPSGLPMFVKFNIDDLENSKAGSVKLDMSDLSIILAMPELMDRLEEPRSLLQHMDFAFTVDRLCSGLLVLTKNEKARERLRTYFRSARAQKMFIQNYQAITLGIPEKETDRQQLQLERRKVKERLLTFSTQTNKHQLLRREAIRPDVKHKILHSNTDLNCAHISLRPTIYKWDCLHLYLIPQLVTMLGDHVYSSRVSHVSSYPMLTDPMRALPQPQIIPDRILQHLQLHQEEAQQIPLHLHCAQLRLPDIKKKGKFKVFKAPPPTFFTRTLAALGMGEYNYPS